jgi:hypothetical protein
MNSRDDAERYKQRRLGCQVNKKEVSLWQYRASWAPESNWLVTPNQRTRVITGKSRLIDESVSVSTRKTSG